MTGADKIRVPGQSVKMGAANKNLKVGDLVEGISIEWKGTKGSVSGTIKKNPAGMEELYGPEDKDGHFFPIAFKASYLGSEIELTGSSNGTKTITPSAADPYLIIRLENLEADKVTAKVSGTEEEVFELDFSKATRP